MNDPINSSSPETLQEPQVGAYLVRHNETIVGIFETEDEAADAKNGYEMQNDIQLGDTLDVLQII